MALVSKSIPNFINGVSQQPPALRLAGQGEIQENGLSDVVAGLKKRPSTIFTNELFIKDSSNNNITLSSDALASASIHTYQRSVSEQYTVIFIPQNSNISIVASNALLLVYDINGSLRYQSGKGSFATTAAGGIGASIAVPTDSSNGDKTDSVQDQQTALDAYFTNGTTKEDLATTSVSDYTFMVNKQKVVNQDTSTPSFSRPHEGMFYLKIANYARNYEITGLVKDSQTEYFKGTLHTADGSASEHATTLRTGLIMDNLSGKATHSNAHHTSVTSASVPTNFTRNGTAGQPFVVYRNSTDDFDLFAKDDDGGTNLRAFKDTATKFTDLPITCSDGFVIQVEGDSQKKEDDFYVQYQGTDNAGTWKECAVPSRPNSAVYHSLDQSTMPHTLVQNSNGSFTFCTASWDDRLCGDDNTNPFPSFVGNTINDVFFHRNRLGFLSDENVIFSEASSYFNFFRVTVRSLLDSAPIDVGVSQNEVSILKHAVPFQEQLLMFSDLNQFSLNSDTLLTPSEVAIDTSTSFDCNLNAAPVAAGKTVYFATSSGNFSGVREYVTNVDLETNDAPLITAHIPNYIKGGITDMVASTNEDTLIVRTDNDLKEIYIYKWYEPDKERLQSSWSKWIFDQDVVHVCFNGSKLYIVFKNGSFEYLDFDKPLQTTSTTEATLNHFINFGLQNGTYSYQGTNNTKGFIRNETATSGTPLITSTSDQFTLTYRNLISECFVQDQEDGFYRQRIKLDLSLMGHTDYNNLGLQVVNTSDISYTDLPNTLILNGDESDPITVEQFKIESDGTKRAPISSPKKIYAEIDTANQTVVLERYITQAEYNSTITSVLFQQKLTIGRSVLDISEVLLDHVVKVTPDPSDFPSSNSYDNNLLALKDKIHSLQSDNTTPVLTSLALTADTVFVDRNSNVIATGATPDSNLFTYLSGTHTVDGATVQNYVYVGKNYNFKYQLSEQMFSPEQNDVQQVARFQLKQIHFHFTDTGDFNVTVESTGRDTKTTKLGESTIGQNTNLVGYQPLIKFGTLPVGVQSQSKETKITLINNTHKPCVFQSAEWEAMIEFRGKRI